MSPHPSSEGTDSLTNREGEGGGVELRHYPRRSMTGGGEMEIVDRQFDFVRCILPYDYAYTSNGQQWSEAQSICEALEGPMSALGIVRIAAQDTSSPNDPLREASEPNPTRPTS